MSQPETDPNETVEMSGADFAMLKDELETLRNFYIMFKSYNPDLPMGPGMKAEFNLRRSLVEEFEQVEEPTIEGPVIVPSCLKCKYWGHDLEDAFCCHPNASGAGTDLGAMHSERKLEFTRGPNCGPSGTLFESASRGKQSDTN